MFKLSKEEEERALQLHQKATVIDGVACIMDNVPLRRSNGEKRIFETRYLPKLLAGQMNAVSVTVVNPNERYAFHALQSIADYHSDLEESSDKFRIVTSARDIEEARKQNKVAVILSLQSAEPIEADLRILKIFYKLGVRIIIPCYGRRTIAGDGCSERTNCGLSNFGVELIEEMNRLNILIDLSHLGRATFMDVLKFSKKTVVATHSNANSLVETTRNLTDEQIKGIAERGGVIGISAYPGFVARPTCTVNDFLDHIDYMVKLVGVDHVGLGFDFLDWEKENILPYAKAMRDKFPDVFGPSVDFPAGLEGPSKIINVTRGLIVRGFSDEDIQKILGLNFLRVFKEVF